MLEPSVDVSVLTGRWLAAVNDRTDLEDCRDQLPSSIDANGQPVLEIFKLDGRQLLLIELTHRTVGAGAAGSHQYGQENPCVAHQRARRLSACLALRSTRWNETR